MPLEIVSEIIRGDASEVEQEPFEAALPAADRLDVVRPSDALSCGLVQGDVGQSERYQ